MFMAVMSLLILLKIYWERKQSVFTFRKVLLKWWRTCLELAYMNSEKTPVLNKEKLNELTAPNWACSIEAARKDLHYNPVYNLKTGLAESMHWYTKGKWL